MTADDRLLNANAARQARAGVANAALARRALDMLGDRCPGHWRAVAELRIANPRASWAELAAHHQVTKNTLTSRWRRLLVAAGLRQP